TRAIAAAWIPGLLLVAALSGCNSSSSSSKEKDLDEMAPRAETAQGPVEGFELGEMIAFRGIPYAAPPVRFAAPEPAFDREGGLLKATEFVEPCAQTSAASPFVEESENEDCLYLNIYKPKDGENL